MKGLTLCVEASYYTGWYRSMVGFEPIKCLTLCVEASYYTGWYRSRSRTNEGPYFVCRGLLQHLLRIPNLDALLSHQQSTSSSNSNGLIKFTLYIIGSSLSKLPLVFYGSLLVLLRTKSKTDGEPNENQTENQIKTKLKTK